VVAFDAVGPSSAGVGFTTSPGTWTHVNNGNGIVVGCTVFTGSSDTVTGVTYGGVALTKIGFVSDTAGGVSFWGLIGPTCPTGSNTVSVAVSDGTNNHNAGSISVSAAGSFGTPVTGQTASNTTSLAVTVNGTVADGLIVSVAAHGNSGTWGFTGGTVQWSHNGTSGSGADNGAGGTIASAGGNQTVTWTNSTSDAWAVVAVEILPAGASGPPLLKYVGGKTRRRKKALRSQRLFAPPDVIVPDSVVTPEPVVVAQSTPSQFFNDNPIQVFRSSLQDDVVAASTPEPVVQAVPNVLQWYQNSPAFQSRSSLQDVPAAVQPNVTDTPPASQWFATPKTIVSSAPPPPQVPAEPLVVTSQPASIWLETNTTQTFRSSLQDVAVAATATPAPVVETSQPDSQYFKTGTAQVIQAPQAPAAVVSGPITYPVVVTNQPDSSYYRTQAPQDFRSSTQDTPVATPDPVVVSAPTPQALLRPNLPQVLRNPAAPVVATTSTPDPVVVGITGIPVGRGGTVQIVRSPVPPSTVQHPICYSGTVIDENLLGGTVVNHLVLGGTVVDENGFAGNVTNHTVFGGNVVNDLILGGGVSRRAIDGALVGWCMLEVDITLGEFNDETLDVSITSGGSPFNITGLTMEMYLKTAAGVSDTDPSTVKLTTPTDITITNGPGGLATVVIPNADLQPGDNVGFYRYDILQAGKRHTALFGKVTVTSL